MPFNVSGMSRRNAEALIHSINHNSHKHKCITEKLLRSQIALLRQKAFDLQAQHRELSIPLRRLIGFNMRVRQLLSIKLSNMCVIKDNNRHFSEDLKWISALVSSKRIVYNLENLVHVITKPLVTLGVSTPTDLLEANDTHTITGNALKLKLGRHRFDEHIIALNRLSALLNTNSTTVTSQDITRGILRHRSKGCNALNENRKVSTAPVAIEGLCQACEQERTERQATIRVRTPCPSSQCLHTHRTTHPQSFKDTL
jgi:hypothetical protein